MLKIATSQFPISSSITQNKDHILRQLAKAGNNHLWISASNTTAPQSCFGVFMVRSDGVISDRLLPNKPGLLYTTINLQ